MRLAAIIALLALAVATPVLAEDRPLAAMDFLIGCWRGAFADNANIHDDRCFTPMLDGNELRDVHAVRPTSYAGETIYFRDAASGGIAFIYFNTIGGVSEGNVRREGDTLVFPAQTYVSPDGSPQVLRATWRIESADRFVVESERYEANVWRPQGRITYIRVPDVSPPDAAH